MRGVPSLAERVVASTVIGTASTPLSMPVPMVMVSVCTECLWLTFANGYPRFLCRALGRRSVRLTYKIVCRPQA